MKQISLSAIIIFISMTSFHSIENLPPVKDYFSVPRPLSFNSAQYRLSWSAHPSDNYYKQEYLPAGEKSNSFTKMMLMEAVVGEVSLPDIVKAKINELQERKKTDPLSNYEVIQNPKTGENILDFIMSQPAGNTTAIAEWNAYRYTYLPGRKGILLIAYSRRAYAAAVPAFLRLLKTERSKDISAISAFSIPAVTIKP